MLKFRFEWDNGNVSYQVTVTFFSWESRQATHQCNPLYVLSSFSESPHGETASADDTAQDTATEHHTSDDGKKHGWMMPASKLPQLAGTICCQTHSMGNVVFRTIANILTWVYIKGSCWQVSELNEWFFKVISPNYAVPIHFSLDCWRQLNVFNNGITFLSSFSDG